MKHTTKIITVVLGIALVGGVILFSKTIKEPVQPPSTESPHTVAPAPVSTESRKTSAVSATTEKNREPSVIIEVNGVTYTTAWQDGMTLIDGMNMLEKNTHTSFSFKSKQYSSLGEFVYEINGIQESPGKYWLYYVNGKQGSVGVSKYEVRKEDHIEWRQE